MISVIVPVYKVEKYLNRCINSIINQTYRDLEIILVDDGSPDRCGEICDEYALKDNRIKVLHKENNGQSSARNAGLDIATGNYITFVDSDDWIEPQTYTLMLLAIQNNDCDIAICGHRIAYDENPTLNNFSADTQLLNSEELLQEIFGKLNNAAWNKLYRKELIGDLRFPIGFAHGEDLIFNLNYLKNCKSGVINNTPLYNYFVRADSVTNSNFNNKKIAEITSKDMAFKIVKELYPSQIENAQKYCFRARMNLIRSIHKAKQEKNHLDLLNEINTYITDNFSKVKNLLRFKEKIEYLLYTKFKTIYKMIVFLI